MQCIGKADRLFLLASANKQRTLVITLLDFPNGLVKSCFSKMLGQTVR